MTTTDSTADALYWSETDLAEISPISPISTSTPTLKYDPEKVLTDERGRRVPGRMNAAEWARDAVDWKRGTSDVATAMAIALRLDDTLVCWPRQDRIAADICATDRTVRNSMEKLESHRVGARLWLWRGDECSGCVYTLNVDGWLDDIFSDRIAILQRVVYVRNRAVSLDLPIRQLPAGTELSARQPKNER